MVETVLIVRWDTGEFTATNALVSITKIAMRELTVMATARASRVGMPTVMIVLRIITDSCAITHAMQVALLMVSVLGELREMELVLTVTRTGLASNVKSVCLDDGERIAKTYVPRLVWRTVPASMALREMVLASAKLDSAVINVLLVMTVTMATSASTRVSNLA